VRRVARAGGAVATLADRLFIPVGLAVAAGTVYFANGDCTVAAVPAEGGEPEVVAEQDCAYELTASGGYLYWTGSTPGQSYGHVSRIRLDGSGEVQPVVPEYERTPGGLAVAGGEVYWVTAPYIDAEAGEVRRAAAAGGEPVSLASEQKEPADIAVAGGRLFWTNSAFTGGAVMSLALPDGAATPLAPAMGAQGLAADDTTLYVAVHGENLLLAVPLDGGEARVLATDQPGIDDIAVDDTAIYWVNDTDRGAVMMLAK
jgi:sugar lactone lactonase YvrE